MTEKRGPMKTVAMYAGIGLLFTALAASGFLFMSSWSFPYGAQRRQFRNLEAMCYLYYDGCGTWPDSSSRPAFMASMGSKGLTPRSIMHGYDLSPEMPDAWGNPLLLSGTVSELSFRSCGRDRQPHTRDDYILVLLPDQVEETCAVWWNRVDTKRAPKRAVPGPSQDNASGSRPTRR